VTTRYGTPRAGYAEWLAAAGEPRYRADQLWQALTEQRRPLEAATNLPAPLRAALADAFPTALRQLEEHCSDAGVLNDCAAGVNNVCLMFFIFNGHRSLF